MSMLAALLALCPLLASPDSALAARARARAMARLDSALARGDGRQPGDWTVGNDGHKWGIDASWIHLGTFAVPAAILGAVPLNATSNPVLGAREAQLNAMRADIALHAHQAINQPEERRDVRTRIGDAFSQEPVIPQP